MKAKKVNACDAAGAAEAKKPWYRDKAKMCLFVSVFVILFSAVFASCFLHDWGKIDIVSVKFPTENGQYVAADLYKPTSATEDNKAPCIVVVPGFQRTKETQTSMALEYARRGNVVICIDPYAQGDSSASYSGQAATTEGYGAFAVVDYVYDTDNMNYVDKTRIGVAGHSAGGNAAFKAALAFAKEAAETGVSKVHSIFVSGYVMSFNEEDCQTVMGFTNVGAGYALYDEGAFRNEGAGGEHNPADLRYAPETLALVNASLKYNGQETVDEAVIGQIYGSPKNNSMVVLYNEHTLHALQPYDMNALASSLEFFDIAFDLQSDMSYMNQTWIYKEMFQGFMLVAAFVFFPAVGALLLRTAPFKSLVHKLPEKSPKLKGVGNHMVFWLTFAVGAVCACLLYIPTAHWAQQWFATAQSGTQTWFFPQRMTNATMIWAAINGCISLVLFFSIYFIRYAIRRSKEKKACACADSASVSGNTENAAAYTAANGAESALPLRKHRQLEGIAIRIPELLKVIFLGLTIFAIFYAFDYVCFHLFHVDFRFLFISAHPLTNVNWLIVVLMYLPFFFLFYIGNSIRVNVTNRVEGWSEFKSTFISCLGNSIGLIAIMVIQYAVFAATGTIAYTGTTTDWLYVNILFSLIPMMFILPIYQRFFFNRTGKVWLGAVVCCLIFIMMTTSATVMYIPVT